MLQDLSKGLLQITKEVGDFILSQRDAIQADNVEVKSLNSLVTYVDQTAEAKIIEGLKKILPEAEFIAEESHTERTQSEWYWIIDPLDGTTNFIHGIPVYAISIALYHKDQCQLAAVYELSRKEMFHAIKGHGAYLNGSKISVSQNTKLSDSLLATGFPYYDFKHMDEYLKILGEFFETTRGVRRLGSAATDLAYVACGRFDSFFEYGLSPWDVAAGALLVQEAGGVVSDFSNTSDYVFGEEIIASNPKLHLEVQKKLRRLV